MMSYDPHRDLWLSEKFVPLRRDFSGRRLVGVGKSVPQFELPILLLRDELILLYGFWFFRLCSLEVNSYKVRTAL
jgi:hypothetical protein